MKLKRNGVGFVTYSGGYVGWYNGYGYSGFCNDNGKYVGFQILYNGKEYCI